MIRFLLRLSFTATLLVSSLAHCQATPTKTVEADLRRRLQGKMLVLRTPFQPNRLVFDSAGNPEGTPTRGTWSMDGGLIVDKLKLRADRLTIEGFREIQAYVGSDLKTGRTADKLRIEIAFNPADTTSSLNQVLPLVFRTDNEPQLAVPPPDLHNFQSTRFERLAGPPAMYRVRGTTEWKRSMEIDEPIEVGQLENGEKVYVVSKAMPPPRPLKTPDPTYPEGERAARHQGKAELQVVIDQQGLIHTVAATTGDPAFQLASLGVLRYWRFEPARIAGQPVATEITIEFKFQLY